MRSVLCWIWPYVAGALVGWLAAGWLARRALSRQPATIERVVEKLVDNPAHLADIASLSATAALVPQLRSQLSAVQAAQAAAPQVIEKIVEVPIERIVEKNVVDTAGIESRDREIADWRVRCEELQSKLDRLAEGPAIDLEAARAAGFSLKAEDDLEIIEGIGPKIALLLRAAGVQRFWQLSKMTPAQIQPLLDAAGPNYRLANPGSWPEQAALAANNQWHELKSLQDVLIAGLRK